MPLTSPEMLIMQERLRALAAAMEAAADEITQGSSSIEDAEYTAGMMRLNAQKMRQQADALEDDDDLEAVNHFITHNELEIKRLRAKLADAGTAKRSSVYYTKKAVYWRNVSLIGVAIVLLNLGFQFGLLVGRW